MTVEESFLAFLTAFRTGDGEPPDDGGWQDGSGSSTFNAYVMVTFGPGFTDGSITDLDTQIEATVYTTCVAATAEGARNLASAVMDAVRGQRIDTGERVTTCPITIERVGAVDRDDTVQPPVWMAVHEFRVDTVPTGS